MEPGPALDLDALDDAASLLAAARRRREDENRAAADVLVIAAKYAALHSVDSIGESARLDAARFGDRELALAGEGAPQVAESAAVEFAAALGMSTLSGKRLLGQAIELRYRLPHVWARVLDGTLPAWKARRIAEQTIALAADAAAWVDIQLAPSVHQVGPTRLDRLITDAIALYDPDTTAALAEEALDQRHVDIETNPLLAPGSGACATVQIHAALDVADALDLEAAVSAIATGLLDHEASHDLPLDARRAAALGVLARAYNAGGLPDAPGTPRTVTLHIHTDTPDLADTGLVRLGNTRGLATIEQLHRWATTSSTSIRPVVVVDLNEQITRDGYTPSATQREQATLMHQTCAFLHCHHPAQTCDLDHRTPFDKGGGTSTDNLTPLCRTHHRAKTHLGWTYQRLRPGHYQWRSPHGYTFHTTPDGTTDVTGDPNPGAA